MNAKGLDSFFSLRGNATIVNRASVVLSCVVLV